MVKNFLIHPREYARYLSGFPSGLLIPLSALVLTIIGLVALSSATQSFAGSAHYFQRQGLWLVVALIGGFVSASVDWERLRDYTPWIAAISIISLLMVFIPGFGMSINGARRWVNLGFMNLQVSEIAKIGMIFVLSDYLAKNQRNIKSFVRGFVIPCCWIGTVGLLIIKEPDFGTAFLTGVVGCSLLFLAGVRLWYLIPSLLAALCLFSVAVYLDPIRLVRVTSFLDVEGNKSDKSYQLWQGILAFGNGGVHGVGIGNGRQQLSYLPESHTDFIASIIGEEMGVFFTCGIVILFAVIFFTGVHNLRRAPNLFQFSFVTGALLFMVLQATINLGVVTGVLPTKGMSLPFISYGGSNLVLMFVFCGLMLNSFRSWEKAPLERVREI